MTTTSNALAARKAAPAQRLDGVVFLLALASGAGVANVYYVQPILPLVQDAFGATSYQAGLAPTLTQVGYALGMLFLAPLGDLVERKRLILVKSALMVLALVLAAITPTLSLLIVAGVAIGVLGSLGQDFIPVAAHIAPEASRGKVVGIVTTGLLTGILLSRTLSGFVGEAFGWRAVYWMAAGLVAATAVALWRVLPTYAPAAKGSYVSLIRSLGTLMLEHPRLRKAALTQALLALPLGAFWSTLAFLLAAPPFNMGAAAAGAFGFVGAAGAMGASVFGHLADKRNPDVFVRVAAVLVLVAFVGMLILPVTIPVLIVGALVFDLGVMAGLVSHQAIIANLDHSARSRLNGLLMTSAMIGVAVGAAVGNWAWGTYGWVGVCGVGVISAVLALLRSTVRSPE
ncbi:Predicted arabinose efflux permease, MFS family [Sphingobium sp. AP50]|uniref:MFS transporter n=1 Tax=Sphingobium sp. AP50 TaxID=1884369 RepID=UPI0008CAC82A|nr:MFS transporter [Sphingobium sp. AP50]SEJ90492.1 Predicted arabinose efflux permease, MFS family [Sphingobium sp. AP50]